MSVARVVPDAVDLDHATLKKRAIQAVHLEQGSARLDFSDAFTLVRLSMLSVGDGAGEVFRRDY
jgi:hypothetical protein